MEEGKEKKRLNQGEGEGENGWGREERRDEKEERRDSRESDCDFWGGFTATGVSSHGCGRAMEDQEVFGLIFTSRVRFELSLNRAMIMGLMLHANTKNNIMRQLHKDALEVLTTGECSIFFLWEAFSLCDPRVLEVAVSWLSVAGIHLDKASEGLKHCHGKDLSCVKLLQAGRLPELSLHMRLELLEEVVAYHNGQFDESRKILTGYARRALQLNNQDIGNAVDFPCEERQ
ncbi:hypothetical protein QQP08_027036 [Theobroma cacao]|nr:hypothetical protein QQP08_027036 [Theobroma cacao]